MKRLLASLLLFICLPALADVTWFWRFETETLSSTDDHYQGSADNTVTFNASAALSSAGARVGSLGGVGGPSSSQQYRFDTSTDMVLPTVGAIGFSMRLDTAPSSLRGIVSVAGTNGNFFFELAVDELRVYNNYELTGEDDLMTSDADLAEDVWYGVVFRWDQPNDLRRIEIYDASGEIVGTPAEETNAWTAPTNLANTNGLRIGNTSGGDGTIHFDNFFIADSYDEPLQDYLTITSFTEYGGGGGGSASIPAIYRHLRQQKH